MDDLKIKFWLALTYVKDIGPVAIRHLLSVFQSPEEVFKASLSDISAVLNIRESQARNIIEFDGWDKVDREIQKIKKHNVQMITFDNENYPESLKQIDAPPMILYTKGSFKQDDKYAIAIVGSRMMTEYGKRVAEKIASELSSYGITVISGMAKGIDTISHKGALNAGGRSIAVLGCGIDRPYPYENTELFKSLCKSGCVISEFPMGTPPNKENFPKRNRLISGLSLGVVVVEATKESGSLITANYALEQNKEVFAVPGNITSKSSIGTNDLIKKGAKLVQNVEDILEELHPKLIGLEGYSLRLLSKKTSAAVVAIDIGDDEKKVLNAIGNNHIHIDDIARILKLAPNRLLAILLDLEIKGLVKQTEGKKFCII